MNNSFENSRLVVTVSKHFSKFNKKFYILWIILFFHILRIFEYFDMYFLMNRARILMQKHIFFYVCPIERCVEIRRIFDQRSIYAKVIKAYNGIFEPLGHILRFMGIMAYFGIFWNFKAYFGHILHFRS